MSAIGWSSRRRQEYIWYQDGVESVQVSHHDAVAKAMCAIWKALGAYSQTGHLMRMGFKYRAVASGRLSMQILFQMLDYSSIRS